MVLFPTDNLVSTFKLFWQYPVITEKTFYEQNKHNNKCLSFPWATVIDKNYRIDVIHDIIKKHLHPGRQYYTCCQHISFRKLIPLFKSLGIYTVYTPHKTIEENVLNDIQLKPCPLYAVNVEDPHRNITFKNVELLNIERQLLYSFQGAYSPRVYLTDIRKKIFDMNHPDSCFIHNIGQWHFEHIVYNKLQNKDYILNENDTDKERTDKYNQLLLESRYSLCPSGSGPNSIRFWESLACGSIPVLLSDRLELPYHELWDESIVRISERELHTLPTLLSNIDTKQEKTMRENCIKLYEYYKNNYVNTNLIRDNLLSIHHSNNEIVNFIQRNRPFSVVRLGGHETCSTYEFVLTNKINKKYLTSSANMNGIYSTTNDIGKFESFCEHYDKAIQNADILAYVDYCLQDIQSFFVKKYCLPQIHSRALEPFYVIQDGKIPWTHYLKDKNVLVINPFTDSFEKQISNNFQMFRNKSIFLKDQKFIFYKSYQTIAGNHIHNDWLETFTIMCNDIKCLNFDIALLGCGAYGLPLCNFIKTELNKSAIYVGGGLQLMFGVIGKRWENIPMWKEIIHTEGCEFIKPSVSETCNNHSSIEGGCYW